MSQYSRLKTITCSWNKSVAKNLGNVCLYNFSANEILNQRKMSSKFLSYINIVCVLYQSIFILLFRIWSVLKDKFISNKNI